MTHTEIINKLIGPVNPIGETNADNVRFENLKAQCELVDKLLAQIQRVANCKDSNEHSVKRAATYADKFLTQTIGIPSEG